jgi:hypothetical protein
MERRFRDLVTTLDVEELQKIQHDIETGGIHLKNLVDDTIRSKLKEHQKVCATCNNDLDPYSSSSYTLIFGPSDFRKQASFCGLDCLSFFLINLKEMKAEKRTDE